MNGIETIACNAKRKMPLCPLALLLPCPLALLLVIVIFITPGCQQEMSDSRYTAVATQGRYLLSIWRARTSKEAINRGQKLLSAIPMEKINADVLHQGLSRESGQGVSSATSIEKLKLADILPKDDQVKGWSIAKKVETYVGQDLFRFTLFRSEAEIYHAYHFAELASAEYRNPKLHKEPLLRVDLYDMGSPENAFGIYSTNRHTQSDFEIIGNETAVTMLTLDTWKGQYFLHIRAYEFADDISEAMRNITKYVMNRIRGTTKPPAILSFLPQDRQFVRYSEKFFRNHTAFNKINFITDENIFKLSESTTGLIAEYLHQKPQSQTDTMFVFLIQYPTPNDAAVAYSSYRAYLLQQEYPPVKAKKFGTQSIIVKTKR